MSKPLLRLGSAWYPELWDEAAMQVDLALMQQLGFNAVRVGDFAWSHLEPADGCFDTAWLGRALDLAHACGLGVVLCTPTAGPPAWLLHAHPELAWVERDGYRHGIGGRQAADYAHPLFQRYSRRITEVIARAFGRHPAVIGWQTDNEFAGHQKVSLSAAALSGWRRAMAASSTSMPAGARTCGAIATPPSPKCRGRIRCRPIATTTACTPLIGAICWTPCWHSSASRWS